MTTVAEVVDVAVGGDTHVDTTSLSMLTPVGAVLEELTIDNDEEGYAQAVSWVLIHAPSARLVVGLEGTSSYGAPLCRALQAAGVDVVEVERPGRSERGRKGKSDPGDARLAARKVLSMDVAALPQPRDTEGPREALRLLTIGRNAMTIARTQLNNQLLAALLTGDAAEQALRKTGSPTKATLTALADRAPAPGQSVDRRVRRTELARLASSILAIDADLATNNKQLLALIKTIAPALLMLPGVGPVTAAQFIISYSHHGRCRNEAAFAALAGVCPIPANSGKITQRFRLNRGGDRQLNRALHTVVGVRLRMDPTTQAFAQNHKKLGKTPREIRRILKRYLARAIFKTLRTLDTLQPRHPLSLAA